MSLLATVQAGLAQIDEQHLRRTRRVSEAMCGPEMTVNGQPVLAFCSNDYLGLAAHPALIAALQEGAQLYGAGSGASHLISGHSRAHALLEQRLAEWYAPYIPQAQCLYFCTGYMANLAVLTALAALGTVGGQAQSSASDSAEPVEIFSESLNHASLIDGARLSRAPVKVYPHNDVNALAQALAASRAQTKIVVTDSVFSMDGDLAQLPALMALCEQYDAWLVVDDAHGFGVLGDTGRGALEHFQLRSANLIYMGTLGKAAGVGGAFVAAHADVIDWMVQKARPYIYTTAAPPAMAHAVLRSLDIIASDEGAQARAHLRALIAQFQSELRLNRWTVCASSTAIQPVLINDNASTMRVAAALYEQGMWVGAIRPPTVPVGSARLRITLSAAHSSEQVTRLIVALQALENME